MPLIVAWYVALVLASPADVEALRASAPTYLTTDTAREHLAAARVAAFWTRTREGLVLSVAWHESRYQSNVVSHEPGGLVSCGVMTPEPTTRCDPGALVIQYLRGAEHLRVWLDAEPASEHSALLGYAGGYRLINACAQGPVLLTRKDGHQDDACLTPEVFTWRERLIGRLIKLAHGRDRSPLQEAHPRFRVNGGGNG